MFLASLPGAAMIRYIGRRIFQGLLAIVIVISVIFLVLNLSGDPIRMLLSPTASPEEVRKMREVYGLDRSLVVRYGVFLSQAAHLNFGNSIQSRRPAVDLALERLPATLLLSFSSLVTAALAGIPLGMAAALKRGSPVDTLAVFISMIGQSTPVFWIALILIFLFAVMIPILPPSGYGSAAHLVLPAVSIALFLTAGVTRVTRTSTLEVVNQPFVTVVRSKGLSRRSVLIKHILRNAALPVVTQLSLQMRFVIGGSVVVESIFGWPGIGQLLAQSAYRRDYPVVIAATFFTALFILAFNLLLDLMYTLIDPRIRAWK